MNIEVTEYTHRITLTICLSNQAVPIRICAHLFRRLLYSAEFNEHAPFACNIAKRQFFSYY